MPLKSVRRSRKTAKRSYRFSKKRISSHSKKAMICSAGKSFARKHGNAWTGSWQNPKTGKWSRFASRDDARLFTKCRKSVKKSGKRSASRRRYKFSSHRKLRSCKEVSKARNVFKFYAYYDIGTPRYGRLVGGFYKVGSQPGHGFKKSDCFVGPVKRRINKNGDLDTDFSDMDKNIQRVTAALKKAGNTPNKTMDVVLP